MTQYTQIVLVINLALTCDIRIRNNDANAYVLDIHPELGILSIKSTLPPVGNPQPPKTTPDDHLNMVFWDTEFLMLIPDFLKTITKDSISKYM